MASTRNIEVLDQGVNWIVSYEWNTDQQDSTWEPTSVSFPSAFTDLPDDQTDTIMFELALRVGENRGDYPPGPSTRNIVVSRQGAAWLIVFEWNNNQQTGPWTTVPTIRFPRDFGELNPDQVTPTMLQLALRVNEARGVHE